MTGKSYSKTRVFLSDKFTSPISRKSLEDTALDFRRTLNNSSLRPSLNANLAVKALPGAQSRTNTDGKKRTNTGAVPGVENFGGYRYNPKQKGGPGKRFKPYVRYAERINPRQQTPNWGWIDEQEEREEKESTAHIRIRRYDVNKRTGEVDENSAEELDPFTVSGLPMNIGIQEKRLSGQTIGEMMRGTSLLARAAKAIGVLTDADGRLRCPPGTPAANQFTDSIGSNCFGFSASELVGMARQFAGYIDAIDGLDSLSESNIDNGLYSGVQAPLRNNAKGWARLISEKVKTSGQYIWQDRRGKNQFPSEWEVEELPDKFKWFKNGAKRGRKSLRDMHDRTNAVKQRLGVGEPTTWDKNSDMIEVFDKLRDIGVVTTVFEGRPQTEAEVMAICERNLIGIAGKDAWDSLSPAQKAAYMQAEMNNYFIAERAMLEQLLKAYTEMPNHMRTVDSIRWNKKLRDNSEAMASWDFSAGAFGGESSRIDICLPQILANARRMLPPLEEYQKARVDAIGGGSDAENAAALNDYLVSALAFSKETAAMIGGLESFARHIMSHEIVHTTQFKAITDMVKRQLNADGSFTLPNGRTITSWEDITNQEWQDVMNMIKKDPNWLMQNVRELQGVVEKADAVHWLAGRYIWEEYPPGSNPIIRALEITAELGALREQGIIYGPEVDDALAFVDAHVDRRFNEERGISDAEETARFIELVGLVETGQVQLKTSEALIEKVRKENERIEKELKKEEIEAFIEDMNRLSDDELVDAIAYFEFELEKSKDLADADPRDLEKRKIEQENRERLSRAKKVWRDRTGLDDNALKPLIKLSRDDLDLLSDSELEARSKRIEMERMREDAARSTPEQLITRLAFIETELARTDLDDERRKKLKLAKKIYRDEYRDKARDSGEDISTQKLNREIDKLVDEFINPPKPKEDAIAEDSPEVPKTKTKKKKPIKTPKNKASVTKLTDGERQETFKESTPEERIAIIEMSDPEDKDIAMILDPEKREEAINRIRNMNSEMVNSGVDVDPSSTYEASLEEQLENVLLPTLDLIDRSSMQNTVQVEASIDLTDGQLDGSEPINIEGLISGRLITGENGIPSTNDGVKNKTTGKTPHKLVIQVEEGQKGYYPHWSDESSKEPAGYEQKVVLPPGELEIVETITNKDGTKTLVARIKRQKTTEEILDGVLGGEDMKTLPPGARHDIEKAINKHIISRRKRGLHSEQKTPTDVKEQINETNSGALDAVNDDGGSFGASLDKSYVSSIGDSPDAPGSEEENIFGPIETAKERRRLRSDELAQITQRLKEIFDSGEADEELGISPEDIDPEIVKILTESTPQEIEEILADEAEKVHEDIDARPRVVVDEEDLEEIIEEADGIASGGTSSSKPWWEDQGKPGLTPTPPPPGNTPTPTPSPTPSPVPGGETRPILPSYIPQPRPQDLPIEPIPSGRPQLLSRKKGSTSAIKRVVDAAKTFGIRRPIDPRVVANEELERIQDKVNRGDFRNYSGAARDAQKVLLSKFGTTNLSELSDSQISEAIDALKQLESKMSSSRNTRAEEIEANKKRAISQLASELLDYIDIRKMRDTNNYRDPYDDDNPSNWFVNDPNFLVDRPEPRRLSGLSSGSDKKIGTVSDGPVDRVLGNRKVDDPDKSGKLIGTRDQEVDSDVYQIGNEKLVFGSESIDDPSVKVLPINPYEISGLSPESEEGRKSALLWFSATVGSMTEQTGRKKDGGKTSALLYAASRGDSDAQAELERLAKIGDEKMKETLKVNDDFMQRFDGSTREEREADGGKWWQFNHGDAMVHYSDEKGERVSRPFELDDLHMVHQTSFEPQIDSEGNLVLKPAEDFDYVNPLTGEIQLDPVTGKPYEIYRGSMHFSLNHLVEGHIYRPIPTTGTWVVIIPARSMIESNPGALDNLYSVDTFLTPRPGEGLKISAGQFKIVKLPGTDVDRESPEFQKAALELEKESQRIVNEALQEVGVQHTGIDGYRTPIFAPGMHGSSAGVDRRMRDIAFDQGVASMKHDGHPVSRFEQINTLARYRDIPMSFSDSDYTTLGYMSENARLRVANNNRFSNAADKEEPMDSGLFSGSSSRKTGGGFAALAARQIIGRVLDSRDDIDDDTKEKLLLASQVVASVAAKGPTGALTQIAIEAARRGGREVAEIAIKKLVASGKITPEQARIAMQGVDRVAPNGLPDEVVEKLVDGFEIVDEFIGERVLTDENKQRVIDAVESAKEKASDVSGQAREAVGDAAKKAKEKSKEVIGRLKRKKEAMASVPTVDDVVYDAYSSDDPFSSPPVPSQAVASPVSIFDDPFQSPVDAAAMQSSGSTEDGLSGRQRLLRRISERRNTPSRRREEEQPVSMFDPDDPFVGLSSGRSSREETTSPTQYKRKAKVETPDIGESGLSSGAQYQKILDMTPEPSPNKKRTADEVREDLKKLIDIDFSTGRPAKEIAIEETRDVVDGLIQLFDDIQFRLESDINLYGKNLGNEVIIQASKTNHSNAGIPVAQLRLTDDDEDLWVFNLSFEITAKDGTQLGFADRKIEVELSSGEPKITVSHDGFELEPEAQGAGIGSKFLAHMEKLYEVLGVESVSVDGTSDPDRKGVTHWARNGFTWSDSDYGQMSKQKILRMLKIALEDDFYRQKYFSDEEAQRISSLISVNEDGSLNTNVEPEELFNFAKADKLFSEQQGSIEYSRKIKQPVGLSSGSTNQSDVSSSATRPRGADPRTEVNI